MSEITDEMIERGVRVFKERTHPQPGPRAQPGKWDDWDRGAVRAILKAALEGDRDG